jgi:hypothetical protein
MTLIGEALKFSRDGLVSVSFIDWRSGAVPRDFSSLRHRGRGAEGAV